MKVYNCPSTTQVKIACNIKMGAVDGVSGSDPTNTGTDGGGVVPAEMPRHL